MAFLQEDFLNILIRNHTLNKYFQCNQCENTFKLKGNLSKHMRTHTGERPYQCCQCDKAFTTKSNLKSHMAIHTGEKPYQCGQCDKAFKHRCNLKNHISFHTGESPYHCTTCDKTFPQKSSLKDHMVVHSEERPFKCSLCSKTFKLKNALKLHMTIHTREKTFHNQCSLCYRHFKSNIGVEIHIKPHTGQMPFQCRKCDKTFSDNRNLKQRKLWQCNHCGMFFLSVNDIISHMRSHKNYISNISKPQTDQTVSKISNFRTNLPQDIKYPNLENIGVASEIYKRRYRFDENQGVILFSHSENLSESDMESKKGQMKIRKDKNVYLNVIEPKAKNALLNNGLFTGDFIEQHAEVEVKEEQIDTEIFKDNMKEPKGEKKEQLYEKNLFINLREPKHQVKEEGFGI